MPARGSEWRDGLRDSAFPSCCPCCHLPFQRPYSWGRGRGEAPLEFDMRCQDLSFWRIPRILPECLHTVDQSCLERQLEDNTELRRLWLRGLEARGITMEQSMALLAQSLAESGEKTR